MPNRRLNEGELQHASRILEEVRARLRECASGDEALYWALRRKVYKELGYDERGKPMHRKMLKMKKWKQQKGKCVKCQGDLPEVGAILDRIVAMDGYTDQNTQLLCPKCDTEIQSSRGYA